MLAQKAQREWTLTPLNHELRWKKCRGSGYSLAQWKSKPNYVVNFLCNIASIFKAILWFLPPANEVWGKVISLQASVCPQGGEYLTRYTPPGPVTPPWEQTPPQSRHLLLGPGAPPWADTPLWPGTPPRADTPHPPGPGTPPGPGAPPGADTHLEQTLPGTRYTPQSRHPPGTRYTPWSRHIPPQQTPPWDQVHPLEQTHPPQDQVHPPEQIHSPGPGTPPGADTPLGPGTPPRSRCPPGPGAPPKTRYTPRACWETRSTRGRSASYWNAILS